MHSNRLKNEKSPYLLQHAHNPVDWYPWSEEAFDRARAEDKPVFLSIGYATCHWCHVMERESFEDEEAARHLNDTFICIKVDREERPDIDAVYMAACQMLTGRGGWPLTIFMTPDKRPFFAGTYLPKQARFGQNGLVELCDQVKTLWQGDRQRVLDSAGTISGHLNNAFAFAEEADLTEPVLTQAYSQLENSFDAEFGGFEPSPKFPTPHRLLFLMRHYRRTGNRKALDMVNQTLTAMRLGGIWDHIGFGFHRYSTDRHWLLPHFEKMLYDQALLALVYLNAYALNKTPLFRRTAEEIFTYLLRDMTDPAGGFYAAEDADSEGEEGKFYVWTLDEFRTVLGEEEAGFWAEILRLSPDGNFADEATGQKTGANIPHLNETPERLARHHGLAPDAFEQRWETVRQTLFQHREQRIHPLKDDKILTDWNGLMIAALAVGGRVLDRPDYTAAAEAAARFMEERMVQPDGALLHRYREGEAGIAAHADDYAFMIWGLLELYRTTFQLDYLDRAVRLQTRMLADFWDSGRGGFFLTSSRRTDLPVRPKELYDGAVPSANSVSLINILRLARLTGNTEWEQQAGMLPRVFAGSVKAQPAAFTQFLIGFEFALSRTREIVVVGEPDALDTQAMLRVLNQNFTPTQMVLLKTADNAERLAEMAGFTAPLKSMDGKATVYVCTNFSCAQPTTDPQTLAGQIEA